jgi:hypothetical protein
VLRELAVAQVTGGQDGGDLLKIVVEGFDWLGLGFRPQKRCSPAGEPWGAIALDAGGNEAAELES